mgnify:CR=1 FL=1
MCGKWGGGGGSCSEIEVVSPSFLAMNMWPPNELEKRAEAGLSQLSFAALQRRYGAY